MKKYILTIWIFFFALASCGKSKQYGVDILKLDNFNFDLNIEDFFQDESIFRGTNDNFSVSSSEESIEGDSLKMGYIQYSTTSTSLKHPLASYADVKFESLGIVTDEADEKVLMAIASTDYASEADIEKIINQLLSEYDMSEPIFKNSYEGINLIFTKGNKVANFYMNISIDEEENSGSLIEIKEKKVSDIDYKKIKMKIRDKKKVSCILFLTLDSFDKALEEARSFSGDLTRYRN